MSFFDDLFNSSMDDIAGQVASGYTPSTPTMSDIISSVVGGGGDTNFGGYNISPDSYTAANIDLSNIPASFMPGEWNPTSTGGSSGPLASILPDWLKSALGSETGKTVLSGLGLLAGGMNAYNQYQANQMMKDYYDQQRQLGLQKQAQAAVVQAQNAAPINAPMTPGYADMVDLSNVDLTNYGRQKGQGGKYGLQFYTNPAARALGNINTISPAPRQVAQGGLIHLAHGGQVQQQQPAGVLPLKIQGQSPVMQSFNNMVNKSNRAASNGLNPAMFSYRMGVMPAMPVTGAGPNMWSSANGHLVYDDNGPDMRHGGQSDNVHAMLSPGEYVMDADTVSALGDGDTDTGAARLDHMRKQIRTQKRGASPGSIPPKAKSPLSYLKGAK